MMVFHQTDSKGTAAEKKDFVLCQWKILINPMWSWHMDLKAGTWHYFEAPPTSSQIVPLLPSHLSNTCSAWCHHYVPTVWHPFERGQCQSPISWWSTAGELKIDQSFGINFSTPGCARKLVNRWALDLFCPQVVAVQISASYIKNSDLYDSLNKVKKWHWTRSLQLKTWLVNNPLYFWPVCTSILQVFFIW